MKKIVFLFFVLVFLVSLVGAEEFSQNQEETEFLMEIFGTFESTAQSVTVDLYLFPRETENQEVVIVTLPDSSFEEDSIVFEFDEQGFLQFEVEAQIKNELVMKRINNQILLSECQNPSGLEEFTESGVYVLSEDPFIKNKAQQLATNDVLETLHSLAEYVKNNMNYNERYSDVKNASWIMEEKKGVCSHYTILFMSLVRSLDLATRYVSGVAYSNKENSSENHAWAEVWIPDYGWIPYDVTFGQYGWLDASHIVLKYSSDAGGNSAQYRFINGKIENENLEISTEITKHGEKIFLPFEIEIEPLLDMVSTNSYVPVEVKIKNPYNYYISVPVYLNAFVFGENNQILFLKPNSEASIFFIVYLALDDYLKCGDDCVATIKAEDVFENSAYTLIRFKKGATKISLSEAQIVTAKTQEGLDFYCGVDDEFYYDYENISIECIVTNKKERKELSICNQDICERFIIDKDEKKNVSLEIPASGINISTNDSDSDSKIMKCLILCVTAKESRDILGVSCLELVVLESPTIKITSIENTETDFGNKHYIEVMTESNTESVVKVLVETDTYEQNLDVSLAKGMNMIKIPIKTWKLDIGDNSITINLNYKDNRDKNYEQEKSFFLKVNDINAFKKLIIKIIHLFG